MTDFRLVCGLHAYSGGTVPDSDRIHYSPLSLRRYQRHSNAYSITPKIKQVSVFVKRVVIFYQNFLITHNRC